MSTESGTPRDRVVAYLDGLLEIAGIDEPSLNGLQVEGAVAIERVAVAVDAAAATIERAIDADCQLLFTHHGLFWGPQQPLRGILGARVRRCFTADLNVYAAHLPLDLHPEVGNNVLLARALGAEPTGRFGSYAGVDIGTLGRLPQPIALAELAGRFAAIGCDEQLLWATGPDPVETLAVVTGAGASTLAEAAASGADCLVTGEPRQSAYHDARELGINCLFGGHYATETLGVRAVGERLAAELGVEIVWIDHPTGV